MKTTTLAELETSQRELIELASAARENAYAPQSEFLVGAALRATSGKIYCGVNVENRSYGLTMCAERVAIGSAVTAGEREFSEIAVVTEGGHMPCGACRQVIVEFGDITIVIADSQSDLVKLTTIEELLPGRFEW